MKVIPLVLGLAVGIMLMTGLIAPVVTAGVTNTTTEANNTSERYLMAGNNDAVLIEKIESGIWAINGENFTIPSPYFTIGFGEKGILRFGNNTIEIIEGTTSTGNIVKLIYENSVLTATKTDDSTVIFNWSFLFYPAVHGTWGMFEHIPGLVEKVNIDNTQTAYFVANTAWDAGLERSFYGIWAIKNGEVTDTIVPFTYNTAYGGTMTQDPDAVVTLTATDSEDGLSKEYSGGEVSSGGNTYRSQSYIIAPITYHIHTAADNMTIAMLNAVVMIGFVALLAYAAYSIRGREFD